MVSLQRSGHLSAVIGAVCLVAGPLVWGASGRTAFAQEDSKDKPRAAAPTDESTAKPDDGKEVEPGKRADRLSLAGKTVSTIRSLPRSHSDVDSLYEKHRGHSCEIIPPGEPFEIVPFTMFLTGREKASAREIPFPSSRRHMFSVGIAILPEDQRQLPSLSGREIMKYINGHYVSVQARVQKDPVSGTLFLNHRPLAATMPCDRIRVTQEFTPPVQVSTQAYYGIGLYLEEGQEPVPENLRTLVLLHRNRIVVPGAITKAKPIYEWTFVRGRPLVVKGVESLELHTFVTTGERSELHYIRPAPAPRRPQDCSLIGSVIFTSYSKGGLIPETSAMRRSSVKTKVSYSIAKLDELAKAQEWNGGAFDNLAKILDAIIDKKLPSDIAALSAGELADVELQHDTDDSLSAMHDPNQELSEFDKELAEIRARQKKSPTIAKEFEELAQSPVAWASLLGGLFVVFVVRKSFLKRKQLRAAERSQSKSSRSSERSQRRSSGRGGPVRASSSAEGSAEEPDETSGEPVPQGAEGAPSRGPQVSLAANAAYQESAAPPQRPAPKAACIRNYRSR